MYHKYYKRFFDLLLSLILLMIFLPFIILLCILLFLFNRQKVFFLQERPGLGGRLFRIIKFKTMTDKRDESGNLLPDHIRLTKLGRFIRKFSLDEILQLINVCKGDMSLIGPRPLLPEYLPLYTERQKKRHYVRPGITGWAQINGRNSISWEEKFELDIWYVENYSFSIDILILIKTIKKVLATSDINASNSITSEKFTGSR